MKIKEAIEALFDGESVIRFQADDIRSVPIAMAYNTINDRHFIMLHTLNGHQMNIKEADLIKVALEQVLLERHVITTGVTRTGNGLNTGHSLEWRVINRSNIFILPTHEREMVKAWLARIPQPDAPKIEQPGLWGQA